MPIRAYPFLVLLAAVLLAALALGAGPAAAAEPEDEPPAATGEPEEAAPPPPGDEPAVPAPDAPAPAAGDDAGFSTIEDAGGDALRVDIVGTRPMIGADPRAALRVIPGAGGTLDTRLLRKDRTATTLQETLRGQSGVHIRDEVAGGVVANIGFRGLNPDRSESILLLEDGVLAGFAPYTVNAAYYVPPSERIAAIEILKGSGQILYGPHTVGPVLNLITHEIPRCPSGRLIVTGGSHDHYSTYASYGATRGRFGFLVSALATWSDGYRDHNSFEVLDAMLKTRWSFSRRSHLTAKFAAYSSDSQNTYLGLTTGMFAADPYQNPAARDVYETAWYNGQLTWKTEFNRCLALLVNVYAAGGSRDWNRQDFARNNGFAAPPANTQFTVGDPAVDGGAIYMRESFGSRDRDSIYWGIEPRLTGTFHVGGRRNDYEVGVRFHDERYTNERNNRTTFDAPPTTRDRDVNDTHALSFFAQDRVRVNRWLHLIGGVRVEHYESTRRFEVQAGMPVAISGTTTNTEVIPGLGFTAQVGRGTTVFGGVHRGFAPPRVAQAIDATGMDLQLDAEKSWNYEIGVRGDPRPWLHYEAAGFYMDFENQVVPANESGGASTMNTNAGETEHLGFELAGTAEVLQPLTCRRGPCRPKLYLDASYTYVHTENTTPAGTFRGNDVPYAPNHLARVGLRGELPVYGLTAAAVATYTGSQFADQANTIAPSNDGTTGKVEDRWLLDVTLRWKVQRTRMTLFASVNNVLDETYIVSRAPSGIFAGAPRHAFFGFELDI